MDIKVVYVCKVKILGFGFAVFDKAIADAWVTQDPDSNYYDTLEVKYEL